MSQIASAPLVTARETVDGVASEVPVFRPARRLYASNWNNTISISPASPAPIANTVSVFDIAHDDAPLKPIAVGNLLVPTFLAFDGRGRLYISDYFTQSVTVFDTNAGNRQLPSITAGLKSPQGIAFDRHGKLYVANTNQINVFDTLHGNAVLPPIATSALYSGVITIDASGKLYFENGIGQIAAVDTEHGNAPLPSIDFYSHHQLFEAPLIEGMTVDASGKLYVAVSANSVLVFDTRHGNAPLPSITGDISFDPAGMAIDENGLLYVANLPYVSQSSVMVFNTKSANALIGTITGNGMEWSNSIALQ